MPAIAEEIEQAHEEGIEFAFLRSPVGFEGTSRLSGVRLAHIELGPADASGRRSPVLTDRVEVMPCDVALLALGQSADLSLLPKGWTLENGRVHQAGAPLAVWAAGDVATGDGTVTHAIGSGRHVAGRVLQHFGAPVSVFERPDRTKAVAATEIRFDHFERQPAHAHQVMATAERRRSFDEADRGLGSAVEAQRCFSCGQCTRCDTCLVYCPEGIIHRKETGEAHYEIDAAFCKGCGICVTECPRRAMEMNPS
jgi:2-oxoacid:acceptor oxidoreductase delta subunit (pyruvate/2-ketoisovalerate family)